MTKIQAPAHVRNGARDGVNLGQLIRDCQTTISIAHCSGGDPAALMALACGSIVLQYHIEAGNLVPNVIR